MTPLEEAVHQVALELTKVATSVEHNTAWQKEMAAEQKKDHDEITKLRGDVQQLRSAQKNARSWVRDVVLLVVAAVISAIAGCGSAAFGGG